MRVHSRPGNITAKPVTLPGPLSNTVRSATH